MKFTLAWLKDHLETAASLSQIAEKLVTLGLEVENIENPAEKLTGFVVAEVVEAGRHPNADRLSLCYADAGTGERIQVVCGAPNVRAGMKVAFAPVGVVIPSSGVPLKKGKIRDMDSLGMFCSAEELQLGEPSDGILDLDAVLPAGMPLAEALRLDDAVIDVTVTPNRSDCFGIRGIARDLAAGGIGTLKPFAYNPVKGDFPCAVRVSLVEGSGCSEFQLRFIKNVNNKPSPEWVQTRLRAIGLKPISALVDVTNYLTYDLGRPLHVFDAAKVDGNLTVRLSRAGETFQALNGKEYILEDGMTVIADETGIISLAGIIGGERTACDAATVDVLIECASFDAVRIARTGRALSILSDARIRFERGVDPLSVEAGLAAATNLVMQWCGGAPGEILIGQASNSNAMQQPDPITLTSRKLQALSGWEIPLTEAKTYLEVLGFEVLDSNSASLKVRRPSFRPDIEGSADLVEEVLRLKGYDHIPLAPLPLPQTPVPSVSKEHMVKHILAVRGLNEAVTWSFMAEGLARKFGGSDDASLRVANPISIDLKVMRPSILPNLIEAAIRNQNRGHGTIGLFEVGPQFGNDQQEEVATGLLVGFTHPRHWSQAQREYDVFDAKAHILATLDASGISKNSLQADTEAPNYYHPGRKGAIRRGREILAVFGEIHPDLIHEQGWEAKCNKSRFIGFEIYLDKLSLLSLKRQVLRLSPYPATTHDFSFVWDKNKPKETLEKAIRKCDSRITGLSIFDVYPAGSTGNEERIGLEVSFESLDHPFTETGINEIREKIIEAAKGLGAMLSKFGGRIQVKDVPIDFPASTVKEKVLKLISSNEAYIEILPIIEKVDPSNPDRKTLILDYQTTFLLDMAFNTQLENAVEQVTKGKIILLQENDLSEKET